jgi:uncharacterized membrane protein YwaF
MKKRAFIMLLLLIAFSVFLWARYYIDGRQRLPFFYFSFLAFVVSIALLLLRSRFFFVFLG